jgi:hypothetical protein
MLYLCRGYQKGRVKRMPRVLGDEASKAIIMNVGPRKLFLNEVREIVLTDT